LIAAFFTSGHVVDLILVIIALEFLLVSTRPPGRRQPMIDRLLAFGPGVCLLLALRAALTDAGWIWVAVALAASFPVHIADLMRRRL